MFLSLAENEKKLTLIRRTDDIAIWAKILIEQVLKETKYKSS